MEVFFITAAILANTGSRLLQKYVLKSANPYPFAFLNNVFSSLVFLPLALLNWRYVINAHSLIGLGIAGALWTIIAVTNYHSYKKTDLSVREPVTQTRILFTLFLGILFLGESFTLAKFLGTFIIFFGLFILFYKKGVKIKWNEGVAITLGLSFLIALVSIFDKYCLQYFSAELYGFIVYTIPAFFMCFALPKRFGEVKQLLQTNWKVVFSAITFSVTAYYYILKTFEHLEVSVAYPLLQLTSLLTVLFGIYFFREKENMGKKISAIVVILIGVIILKFA